MNAELQFLTALQGLHTPARDVLFLLVSCVGTVCAV